MGINPKLIRSSGGVFEVVLEGELLWSKKGTGSFPPEESLLAAIKKKVKP